MILVSIDDHVIEPRDMFDAHVPGGWKIDKITWQNTCRFFGYEPFAHIDREVATVGALRVEHRMSTQRSGPSRHGEPSTEAQAS